MSSIRFTSFGAATVPLSKIIPDKDFDIRPYGITAAFAKFPYRPIAWETEALEWGDVAPTTIISEIPGEGTTGGEAFPSESPYTVPGDTPGETRFITCKVSQISGYRTGYAFGRFYINGVVAGESQTLGNTLPYGTQLTVFSGYVPVGAVCSWCIVTGDDEALFGLEFTDTGLVGGTKTFDLTGKWLALGIDMKGLNATVKIQGVEMPYTDYPLYFPIAPSEITIPGDWISPENRPVIEVYK